MKETSSVMEHRSPEWKSGPSVMVDIDYWTVNSGRSIIRSRGIDSALIKLEN